MRLLAAAAIAVGLLLACSPYRVTSARMGAVYPSKGDACTVQFENVTFQEGSSKYESIGLVSLTGSGSDEFTDAMKADVQKAACKMGGDAVSLNASVPGMFQFMVWRAR
ncbi:MAG TPA: hypothetical protein VF765_34950 [Polyangiaceae bacterium]